MPWKSDVMEAGQKKPVQSEGPHSIALEPHYSVPQVAEMWHVSEKTVRRLFDGEPASFGGAAAKQHANAVTKTFAFLKVS